MTAAAATGQTWFGTSRFFIAVLLLLAAFLDMVRRRDWLGSAANGRMAAVAAMAVAVQRSWVRINYLYAELLAAINAMNEVD